MSAHEYLIRAAGLLHLLVASANFVAPRLLDYRGSLARVTPIVRDVFVVQNVYIVLVLVGLAGACFAFPADLAGRSPLGRAVAGFLAIAFLSYWVRRSGFLPFVFYRLAFGVYLLYVFYVAGGPAC